MKRFTVSLAALIALVAVQHSMAAQPPQPGAAVSPPPTAERLEVRRRVIEDSLALHSRLRGDAGLVVDPPGDSVIRIARMPAGVAVATATSLVAVRSPSGWRLEAISVDEMCFACASQAPRIVAVPDDDGRRIDALLAERDFYAQPVDITHPGAYDGEVVYVEVRTPAGRWNGMQFKGLEGQAGALAEILFRLVG
ncbi:hypothetical protein QO010_000121 [Caulobacter ginsengisoli]|uniref:Uncharacterized protein n=1 Tax=Caulobacter ginsengisoli TaxID=400775 RepID=A0ABU0IMK3_9CAUL|nr:hypothetical protein [Caulobacter ginsengisoli]MDQ0462373.1 hypothetical protein [Caulobacter ginsengisoli]